jgi:cytochrome c
MKTALAATALLLAVPAPALAQDVAAGEKVFARCRACHQVGETAKNAVGPKQNGLFGRKAGTIEGFNYSQANKDSGIVWDEKNFAEYIEDPKTFMPGNKMAFAGIKKQDEILNLIAFLKQYGPDGKKM